MDVSLSDPLLHANIDKLIAVNRFCLFHGVFCLSDMKTYDARSMDKGFIHNTISRKNQSFNKNIVARNAITNKIAMEHMERIHLFSLG